MVGHERRVFSGVCGTVGAFLVLSLGACGGSSGSSCEGPGGPDTNDIQGQLVAQINLEADGAAQITRFEETGRRTDEVESCHVDFAGEIEFTADCYFHMSERKPGDRLPFEAEAEFVKDESGWKRVTLGIYPH